MFKDMEYIYEVYKTKSISKAARNLYITQPALSKIIKHVEQQINCRIFDRSTIPLTVTKDGMYYIHAIEQIFDILHNLEAYFNDLDNLKSGSISLGGSSYFCSFIFPKLISHFNNRYPDIQFDLHEGNISTLKAGLFDGSLDLILETAFHNDPDLDSFPFKLEHIILAVPDKFEINKRLQPYQLNDEDIISKRFLQKKYDAVPLKLFENVPFIRMKPGNDMYARSSNMCRNAGFEMKACMYVDQVMTSLNIASEGIGALFIRSDIVQYLSGHNNIIFYKIDDPLAIRQVLWFVKKGKYIPKAVKEFIQLSKSLPG